MVRYTIAIGVVRLSPVSFGGSIGRGDVREEIGRLAVVAWVGSWVWPYHCIKGIIEAIAIAVGTGRGGVRGIVAIGIPAF